MTQIIAYLTFPGNCLEAMTFYHQCLGGKLQVQTIGESPLAEQMPPQMKNAILHSTITKDAIVLQASDMVSEKGHRLGNSISLSLNCGSEEEMTSYYEKLSVGGTRDHEIEQTFWGAKIGDLTDKFGNHWLLHFNKNQNQ